LRHDFIEKVESHCSNFSSLNNSSKFIWLLTNENLTVLKELGSYVSKYYIKDTLKGNVVHFLSFPKNNIDINVQICPVYFDGVEPFQFSEDEQ
jgi:hypothetical protein